MDNKGFGLPELLLFVGISLLTLIVITINLNKITRHDDITLNNNSIKNNTIVPSKIAVPNSYMQLENKIMEVAKKYQINKNENIIISLNQLKKANLLDEIADPYDESIKCNGYVIYNSNDKKYIPYINCPGMYTTNEYNTNFE